MAGVKPDKPYPEFPLYAHASGKWAKKVEGRIVYFGRWEDPDGALLAFQESQKPKSIGNIPLGLSVFNACNLFLSAKKKGVSEKTLSERSYQDYKRTLQRFSKVIGHDRILENLQPKDFLDYKTKFAATNNPVSVGNEVTRIKSCLKWLTKSKHCKEIEVGPDFRKPSALAARRHKREMGLKLFEPSQIQAILDESGLRMRAMILLGINCGYHNSDIETLELKSVRVAIKTGLIEHTREKTEVERGCPLWPESIEALKDWIDRRPSTKSNLAFVLVDGRPLSTTNADVAKRFRAVRDMAGIGEGGFSWLRKTFATYASECGDQVAVNFIMGHVDQTTPGIYRQLVRDKRLQKVVDTVRNWLFNNQPGDD